MGNEVMDIGTHIHKFAMLVAAPESEDEQASVAKDNDAHQELFSLLSKLGASPETLERVLGIEPKEKRKARQAEDLAWKDKMRRDWEAGQAHDATERERIAKERETQDKTIHQVGTLTAVIKSQIASTLVVDYTNTTKAAATAKVRIGNTDRPDRVIAAGKVATSTYTTTSKNGFTGQRILVLHIESGVTILDKVL